MANISLKPQEKDTVIELLSSNEPVKITSFTIGDRLLKSGEKFASSDDYLKDLNINFENISGKTITYLSFSLLFPRPEEQKDVPPFKMTTRHGGKSEALRKLNSGFEIKASSEQNKGTVSVTPQDYETIVLSLSSLNYPTKIKRVQIFLQEIVFDDGTVWQSGTWFRVDPNNPDKLILTDPHSKRE